MVLHTETVAAHEGPRLVGLLPLGSSAAWGQLLSPGGPVVLGGVRPLRYNGDSALAAGPVPAGWTCLEPLLRVMLKSVPGHGAGAWGQLWSPRVGGQGFEGPCSFLSLPGRPPLTSSDSGEERILMVWLAHQSQAGFEFSRFFFFFLPLFRRFIKRSRPGWVLGIVLYLSSCLSASQVSQHCWELFLRRERACVLGRV